MKIIEINATYGFASTGAIVKDIEKTAIEYSHTVGIAYQSAERSPSLGHKIGGIVGYKYHALMSRIDGRQGYASRMATRRLLRWLNREKPDIVHLHNLHSNYINLSLLLDFLAKEDIATVITLHDCWFFTGKCFHFVESNCNRWTTGCGDCPRNKLDVKSLFFDRTAKVYNDKKRLFEAIPRLYAVGCSDWICEQARHSMLSNRPVLRIYNGIDTGIFAPRSTDFKQRNQILGDFMIVGAANKWLLPENKELLDVFLSSRGSEDALVLFGADEEHKKFCEALDGVVALGYINSKNEMAELFSSADVFVNPTHADTLPTVNMESAACGTPVITYNVCGSPELVRDGVTGYIVPEGDTCGVMRSIGFVKEKKIKSEDCRAFALSLFDRDANYKRYVDLFEKIYNGETLL